MSGSKCQRFGDVTVRGLSAVSNQFDKLESQE